MYLNGTMLAILIDPDAHRHLDNTRTLKYLATEDWISTESFVETFFS